MAKYVGAIDQGTTRTRFMIFDHEGHEVARHQLAHEQITSDVGWLMHDPHEIWEALQDVVEAAVGRAGVTADDLAAVGVTSQSDTTVVWDRRTGVPYENALVEQLDDAVGTPVTRDGSAVGTRVRWILQNVDGARADAGAGHAIGGTIDTWLIWWLTGGPDGGVHVTDVTNAARTMLMDLQTLTWDDDRLALFGVPRSMLPEIRSSSQVYGRTAVDVPFPGEVAVAGDLAWQHAALVGQGCFGPGDLVATFGDKITWMLNTGSEIGRAADGLRSTVAYRFGDAPVVYALEGAVAGSGGHAGPEALTAFEATCRQGRDVVDAMVAAADVDLHVLHVAGGVAADEQRMQIQADVLGVPVSRPVVAETSALGAAYAAGLAVGFWASTDELAAGRREARRWEPASADEAGVDGASGRADA